MLIPEDSICQFNKDVKVSRLSYDGGRVGEDKRRSEAAYPESVFES